MKINYQSIASIFFESTNLAIYIFDSHRHLIASKKNLVSPDLSQKIIVSIIDKANSNVNLSLMSPSGYLSTFTLRDNTTIIVWANSMAIDSNGAYEDRIPLVDLQQFKAQISLLFFGLTQKQPHFSEVSLDFTDWTAISNQNMQSTWIAQQKASHNGYLAEQLMLLGVEHGNLTEFNQNYLSFMDEGNFGILASSDLRSKKNITIAATTLFTRAAIRGGMYAENAYNLSDECIKKTEQRQHITNIYEYTRTIGERFVKSVNQVKRQNIPSLVYQAQEYIYDHLSTKLTVNEIALHAGCSQSYLMHLFKQTVGISILNFINQQRIQSIKQQLLFTQLPIGEIANNLGFSDQSQLSHRFKQSTGLSPLQFRNQQKL